MTEEKPKGKPINGERAFEATDARKHSKIVEYVNEVKDAYSRDERVTEYHTRCSKVKQLVNQEWGKDRSTRFALRHGLMRATHDSYIDTFDELYNVDNLIVVEGDTQKEAEFAHDMQLYINRLLRSIKYKQHLHSRFLHLPVYGWSPSHDYYKFNEGFATKANAKTLLPGMPGIEWTQELDTLNDGPCPEVIRPEHWFGSMSAPWDLQYQGSIKRWYLRDVMSALARTDAEGKPLYNVKALTKLRDAMLKGQKDEDTAMRERNDGKADITRDLDWRSDKSRGPFVDVIRYYGPLNEISDIDLAKDANVYYVECTRTELLLWMENPADRHTLFTHMRTHEYIDNPLSRTFLDLIKPHQQFTDFLVNMSMESITDNLTKHWAIFEEDMEDPNDFYSPRGLNAFLRMQGQGRIPELVGTQRSGAFSDIKDLLVMLDRDRQRSGASDQELGALGNTQDKTATASRIMATAATKKIRACAGRINDFAVLPQVKNLTMLSLIYADDSTRKFISGGKEVNITPEHIQWYLHGANVKTDTSITRDRDSEAMKITAFFQGVGQMVGNLADPAAAVYIMRHAADVSGIPQHIIDKALPEPGLPPQIPGPVIPPGGPAMPPMAQQPAPEMMEGEMDELI
jgi:hypothetical protein